jgi:hypothetical protein
MRVAAPSGIPANVDASFITVPEPASCAEHVLHLFESARPEGSWNDPDGDALVLEVQARPYVDVTGRQS